MPSNEICPRCQGTGNAHHSGIANDGDEYSGCMRCGGAGVLDWRNDVIRAVLVLGLLVFMGVLLAYT